MSAPLAGPGYAGRKDDIRVLGALAGRRMDALAHLFNARPASRRRAIATRLLFACPVVAIVVVLVAFAIGSTFGANRTNADTATLLGTMLLIAFSASVAGGLSSSLQSLFLSSEARFLATLPMSMRAVFVARFPRCWLGAIPGALFGVAASLGFMIGRSASASTAAICLVTVILLTGTGIGLAAMVTTAIVRFVPARRTRAVLLSASMAVLGLSSWAWTGRSGPNPFSQSATAASNSHPAFDLLPPEWAARSIVNAAEGLTLVGAGYLGLQIGVFLLVFGATARLFGVTFARNIERTDLTLGLPRPNRQSNLTRRELKWFPVARSLPWVRREWLLLGRDLARQSAAIWPVLAIGISVVTTSLAGGGRGQTELARFWATHGPLLMLPWGLSLGTTIFAIGTEPDRLGLIRALPVRARDVLLGKLTAYLIPTVAIALAACALSVAIAPGRPVDNYTLIGLVVWFAVLSCGLDLSFSALSPRFGADHVQRATRLRARISATLANFGLTFVSLIAAALSPLGRSSLGTLFAGEDATWPTYAWVLPALLAVLGPCLLVALAWWRFERSLRDD